MKNASVLLTLVLVLLGGRTAEAQCYLEQVKLLPDDGAAGDRFGHSVSISGTTAIVGAPVGNGDGSAYLFNTTTGQQIDKFLANDGAGSDRFGESVAISGTTAIVGAEWDDDNGENSGSAYLFDTTTGEQIDSCFPMTERS